MTKLQLSNLITINEKIRKIDNDIIEIRERITSPKNQIISDMPKGSGATESVIDNALTKIERLEEKIKDGKVDLEELEKFLLKEDLTKEKLFNYKEHGVYKIFVRANKKLEFEKFHPHMLRHTCATNLLKNGADLETVRQILGHEDIKQTQQYLHLDTSYIKSVYDVCMK